MTWFHDAHQDDSDFDELDEEIAFRPRPNPKATRPRTKRRPEHSNAIIGRVCGVYRGRYSILIEENTSDERFIFAARARELHKTSIVNGDRVGLVGDTSGDTGTLARIVRITERKTVLRRSVDDADKLERVIVANINQMMIVVAATNPPPRTGLVDRYLVAAYDAKIAPILCITKTDLADPGPFLAHFSALNVPYLTSGEHHIPLNELYRVLEGKETVFVGHSGVGKSTLVNALVPDADRATSEVNTVTGRGRHTSSSTISLRMQHQEHHGWIIDTPGIRSFGLGHVNPGNVLAAFTDLNEFALLCPRGCLHRSDALDCEMVQAVQRGELGDLGMVRLRSLQRLFTSLEV